MMKFFHLACAAAVAYPLTLSAQVMHKTKVDVEVPVFKTAADAVEWAGKQRQVANGKNLPSEKKQALMAGVVACEQAKKRDDADSAVKGRASLQETELFLQLNANTNALQALESAPPPAYEAAGVLDQTYERAGECNELLRFPGALQPYLKALGRTTDPRWKALILYRAAVVAAQDGVSDATALLEQAIALQAYGSLRAVHAQLLLAKHYSRSAGDKSRAKAWLSAGKDGLGKGPKADRNDAESFVPAPSPQDLNKLVKDTEDNLKKL